ncbi:MAG: peptide chain release factor N(5)-glutamine methyltransferase [Eudoraea sp.]|uniref:peptide chain release factor N(5)-glutamine methyltransferase n=1 Tax=Eudoraea sp. TaxID=1979955 RepID=UPI003C73C0BC
MYLHPTKIGIPNRYGLGFYTRTGNFMLLREIKKIFHKELASLYPKEEIDSFFNLMISHYLGLERFVLVLKPNLVIDKKEEQLFFQGLAALAEGIPLQYVLSETEFMGLKFFLNKEVLIPRPETEELVQWVLNDYVDSEQPLRILDIGTGSGCIAISLAKGLIKSQVTAIDVSAEALAIAIRNARNNDLSIQFEVMDILENEDFPIRKYDIIVSNPPYVKLSEKSLMHQNVLNHEPHLALFVPDSSPLKFYKAIIQFSKKSLVENGKLYLEINETEGEGIKALLEENSFKNVEIRKDIFGKIRMAKGSFVNAKS